MWTEGVNVPENITWAGNYYGYPHDARRSDLTEEVHPPYKVAWRQCFLPKRRSGCHHNMV